MEKARFGERIGVVTLPVYGLLVILAYYKVLQFSFPQVTYLYPIEAVLLLAPSFAVSYVATRAYLLEGLPVLLFMGSAVVAFTMTIVASGIAGPLGPLNGIVTIFSSGVMVASLIHLVSSATVGLPATEKPGRRWNLLAMYSFAFLSVTAISVAASTGQVAPFFAWSSGTGYYRTTIAIAMVAYGSASAIFALAYSPPKRGPLLWWTLALGLSSMVMAALGLSDTGSGALSWLGIGGLYLSRFYLLFGIFSASAAPR